MNAQIEFVWEWDSKHCVGERNKYIEATKFMQLLWSWLFLHLPSFMSVTLFVEIIRQRTEGGNLSISTIYKFCFYDAF